MILLALWPGGDGRLARCPAAPMLVPRGRCEPARAERPGVGCLRAGRRAGPAARTSVGRSTWWSARGFGAPATTAECAVGFLGSGGRLVVSEPPGEPVPERWPATGLAELGLLGPEPRAGRGGRDRRAHNGGTAGGAVASACGRSQTPAVVVSRPDSALDGDVSRETDSEGSGRRWNVSRETSGRPSRAA